MSATAHPETGTTTWTIDAAHTTVEFAVKHMMITTVKGQFGAVEGTVTLDEQHPESSKVEATIDTTSIDTRQEQRDAHLRSADFFDVEKFPKMRFVSTKVQAKGDGEYAVTGDLTIRDVTKQVTFEVSDEGRGKDPWGQQKAAFTAKTEISREAYGLTWNQALETGGVLVSDKVKISIDAALVKQG